MYQAEFRISGLYLNLLETSKFLESILSEVKTCTPQRRFSYNKNKKIAVITISI